MPFVLCVPARRLTSWYFTFRANATDIRPENLVRQLDIAGSLIVETNYLALHGSWSFVSSIGVACIRSLFSCLRRSIFGRRFFGDFFNNLFCRRFFSYSAFTQKTRRERHFFR